MTESLIHLRIPAAIKGRWVRASRAAGMRLTDYITAAVEAYMQHKTFTLVIPDGLEFAEAGQSMTHIPNAALHNPDPRYLRGLLESAGITQRAAARKIGISERTMRYYLSDTAGDYRPAPYVVQFALEHLTVATDTV